MTRSGVTTILDHLPDKAIQTKPYIYAAWSPALPLSFYDEVMMAYPTVKQVVGGREWLQNARYDIDAVKLLRRRDIEQVMKDFITAHVSQDFWLQIVDRLGALILKQHPHIEDQVGKKLKDFTVGVRNAKRREDEEPPDVELDAKPGYNTPVEQASSVRGQHVDNPREVFAALMYCRLPLDHSVGGDFVIDKMLGHSEEWKWHGKAELYPEHFENHAEVPYGQNVACFFINSLEAVHHVTERKITRHPRRLMNFIAEVRLPLFAIPKKRFRTPNDIPKDFTEDIQRGELEVAP